MRLRIGSVCVAIGGLCAACGLDGRGTSTDDGGATQSRTVGAAAAMQTTEGGGADGSGGSDAGISGGDAAVAGDAASSANGTGGGSDGGNAASSTHDAGGGDGSTGALMADGAVAALDSGGICNAGGSGCPQGQLCDPALGCVSCTVDPQCPASTRFCVMGNCVQCRNNSHCGTGTTPSCWPADHTCHAACTSSQQCAQDGNTRICDTATGACVGCVSASDCPTSQSVCDPTTRQCVQCAKSIDCAGTSTPACVQNMCVQCATNADCPGATPYCIPGNGSSGNCVQCMDNSQCPATAPSCNSGTCGQPG